MKVGNSVQVISMARTDAIGRIISIVQDHYYVVRLPNWQADGVHLDVCCLINELRKKSGAKRCVCCYCKG